MTAGQIWEVYRQKWYSLTGQLLPSWQQIHEEHRQCWQAVVSLVGVEDPHLKAQLYGMRGRLLVLEQENKLLEADVEHYKDVSISLRRELKETREILYGERYHRRGKGSMRIGKYERIQFVFSLKDEEIFSKTGDPEIEHQEVNDMLPQGPTLPEKEIEVYPNRSGDKRF